MPKLQKKPNTDIDAAEASRDKAHEAYWNSRESRNKLVQPVLDAKAELDEATRLRAQLCEWKDEGDCEVGDQLVGFSYERLSDFWNSLDLAIEKLLERHAAVKRAAAESRKKQEEYVKLWQNEELQKRSGSAASPSGSRLPSI
jgi:hypothetical protein